MCLHLEDLEAVDVEDSDVELLLLLLHGFINTLTQKQERERAAVKEQRTKCEGCVQALTSTRKSKSRAYSALDRASREKQACSVFRVTEMDSVFPPHLLSIILLVSLLQRPS